MTAAAKSGEQLITRGEFMAVFNKLVYKGSPLVQKALAVQKEINENEDGFDAAKGFGRIGEWLFRKIAIRAMINDADNKEEKRFMKEALKAQEAESKRNRNPTRLRKDFIKAAGKLFPSKKAEATLTIEQLSDKLSGELNQNWFDHTCIAGIIEKIPQLAQHAAERGAPVSFEEMEKMKAGYYRPGNYPPAPGPARR